MGETGITVFDYFDCRICVSPWKSKMMEVCENKLSVIQRIFGMTLCSMPFWILVTVAAYLRVGFPSEGQIIQSVGVALFSGVIATVLFFRATELVKGDPNQLAVIEATQSGGNFYIDFRRFTFE